MGSMCAYKSLLLALVLSSSSYASHFKGDINVTSSRGLIKAISLFKGVKRRVLLAINCIKGDLRLSAINCQIFREKYLKPHFVNISWEGEL